MMFNFFRDLWRLMRGQSLDAGCRHLWRPQGFGRRICQVCGQTSLLMENKYPEVGEAKYTWSRD